MFSFLDYLYPSKCGLCGCFGEPLCSVCRCEMGMGLDLVGVPGFRFVKSVFTYRGRAAQAVRRLKYERVTSLARPMSEILLDYAVTHSVDRPDAFVPVPIHRSRLCQRGFNQAELLCETLPKNLVLKAAVRVRPTRPQALLPPEERETNLKGAFRASSSVEGLFVVIVDDVFTTGYTAREVASALKAAGAREIGVLAFAGGNG